MKVLTYATRKSPLALAQSRAFVRLFEGPSVSAKELPLVTSGDRFAATPLQDLGGKGLFIKELEEALLDRRADLAIHSIKDVPAELPEGLGLVCVPKREDARDAWISQTGASLLDMPRGARVGTSSLRRALSIKRVRPDLEIAPLRGNVETRLSKVRSGEFDATLLAHAGLIRLGMESVVTELLSTDVSLPAIGQGALGIEARAGDDAVRAILAPLSDPETELCVAAERGFMAAVSGNCRMPIAAYAVREGDEVFVRAHLAEADGSRFRQAARRQPFPRTIEEARGIGLDLGAELR